MKASRFSDYAAGGPVDALVLGSSRSMTIDAKALHAATGFRAFNFAVEGARAEHYLALYSS